MATTTQKNSRQQQQQQQRPKKKSKSQRGGSGGSDQGSASASTGSSSAKQGQAIEKRVQAALARLEKQDPGLKQLLKKAHGYAVFPSVGKAALVVGGAYGRGAAFEKGKLIGYATLSQMTIGVQIGGDTFTEVLVFHDRDQLERFKKGHMAFAANASAVLVKAAAAGTTDFKGVTALAYSSGGMLLELALGGQKFTFKPLGEGGENGKGESSGASSSRGSEEEEEDDEGDDDDAESGSGGGGLEVSKMLSRAVDGVAKVPDLAKGHPIAATVLGAGALTGLAFMLVRALRQRSSGGSSGSDSDSEEQSDDDGSDEEESDAQGSNEGDDDSEADDDDEEEDADRSRSGRRGRSRV